ncbi:hypothetical protein [Paenisporosarcina sp. OV554]|uniref:hypothetical protein n=1 Tax=Paenisporosarcina sp. OV554 TaxID=2135694 RepID=UPI000D340A52|nr:hypothetical protein [Paenisporosarcina sp. OV554]PUB12590.1 hypothetical protein C8K15_10989 [Paenisporosarcina sp. OV554]
MEIMQANEVAKLSEKGKKQFEKDAFESTEFKSLISGIEENAMKGRTDLSQLLRNDDAVRMYEVFVNALILAGYSSSIKSKTRFGMLKVSDSNWEFKVSWKQEEQK